MSCPLCSVRNPKRICPAVGQKICAVCCGTKRLVEIACPPDCPFLASAREHPPAAIARQRERDLHFAAPMVHKLSERAYRVLLVLQMVVKAHRRTAIPPITDADVADAAGTLASTLDTASRGIIYEHQAASLPAQRLVTEFREVLRRLGSEGGAGLERDAALALRRMERAAKDARSRLEPTETAYLGFLDRLPDVPVPPAESENAADAAGRTMPDDGPRIILP
jgi:hypothetical protein